MDVAAGVPALVHELMHEGKNWVADDVGLTGQQAEVERRDVGFCGDLLGRFRRNDAAARLGACQGDLDLYVTRDESEVGKYCPHPGSTECVAEQDRIEDRRRARWRIGHLLSLHQGRTFISAASA